jgi:hypothetical protein
MSAESSVSPPRRSTSRLAGGAMHDTPPHSDILQPSTCVSSRAFDSLKCNATTHPFSRRREYQRPAPIYLPSHSMASTDRKRHRPRNSVHSYGSITHLSSPSLIGFNRALTSNFHMRYTFSNEMTMYPSSEHVRIEPINNREMILLSVRPHDSYPDRNALSKCKALEHATNEAI